MAIIPAIAWKLARPASLCVVLAVTIPEVAQAECMHWDVSGPWSVIQNNSTQADFVISQDFFDAHGDTQIHGNGAFMNKWKRTGDLDGVVSGSQIHFTVYWTDGSINGTGYGDSEIGDYTGTISPTGRINGTTLDKNHPRSVATWYSTRTMKCSLTAPSGASGQTSPASISPTLGGGAKPAVALGRVRPQPGAASSPPMSICDRARSSRARNSPVAPELERQCQAAGGG